jgi:hypothetical protein
MNPLFTSLSNIISGVAVMWMTNRSIKYARSRTGMVCYGAIHLVAVLAFSAGLVTLIGIVAGTAPPTP